MKLGVVGLPNVGKSTLFNAITKAGAQAANYPFCTIEPNVGSVAVPDERLDVLAEMYNPEKYTPTTIEFVDIAETILSLIQEREWTRKTFALGSERDKKEQNIEKDIKKLKKDVDLTIEELTM